MAYHETIPLLMAAFKGPALDLTLMPPHDKAFAVSLELLETAF